jgi:CPA2 family monovalent cation:H+ antiporter-2
MLNLTLVSGLLITASWIGSRAQEQLPEMKWLPPQTGGPKTVVWLSAMVISLPLLIASFRKVRAAAHIVADLRATSSGSDSNVAAVRALMANTIVLGGGVVIVLWVLFLSSAILPPWPVFVMLMGVILAITTLMGNKFLHVYAKAQGSIRETLTYVPPPEPEIRPIPAMLEDAELETFTLMEGSPAIGKLIRELKLRTKTGASIVGIERQGNSIVNPGPDEELKAGDQVLLLGTEEHLKTAEKFFDPEAEEETPAEAPKAEPKRRKRAISKPVRRHAKPRPKPRSHPKAA